MAQTSDRRGSRWTSSFGRSFPSRGRGGRRRAPKEPTDEGVASSIQQSALRVRVALELCPVENEAKPLRDICLDFERAFETQRSSTLTERHDVCVELLECGLDKWQHVVELQRVLAAHKGLEGNREQLQLKVETVLQQDVKKKKRTLSLSFAGASVDAVWGIANSLMLRLKSCEVLSRVLLPTDRLVVPLLSLGMEGSNLDDDRYQWEGRLVWSQVVLDAVVGEQREEIQRVVLPPFDAAPQSFSAAQLRYPGLVTLVDEMIRSNSGSGKPVVVVMRGIPGSGKSTLGKEIAALCSYKEVQFTMCSADTYFTTPRGYVFDGKKLSAAHETCRVDFKKAITGAISEENKQSTCHQHVVLVENTSTQKWEYAPYEAIAHTYGCRVHIVEMKCPDVLTAFRMGQRNHHGVPPQKVVSMFLRWEEDSRANSFTPQFEHALLSANPLSDSDAGKLLYIGLFLEEKSKTKLVDQIPLVHTKKFADHVTLFYQPNLQYVRDVELGAPFLVCGVEVVQNDRGQTLRVEIDEKLHLQVRNKIPHITLSTAYRVSPVYSNELLSNTLAKRTAVDPPLDLRARIGAVFSIEGEQVITTRSPFDADAVGYDVNHLRCATGNDVSPQTSTFTESKLFILHVKESDFADDTEGRTMELHGMAKVLYQSGSGCKARLLCIQKGRSSLSVSEVMKRVQTRFHLLAIQSFDDVVILHEPVSLTGFDETISKFLDAASLGAHDQVMILTTDAEILQWPLCEIKCFQHAALSVSQIGPKSVVVQNSSILDSPCTTISAVLDFLGMNIEEQTQSIILRGIGVIDDAWKRVTKNEDLLYRIDTTIMSMSSPVVDLCLVLPSGTSLIKVATMQEKLLSELSAVRSVQHVVFDSSVLGRFYLSICTASSYSPAFCVQMTSNSEDSSSGFDKHAAVQLNCWQQIRQSSRKLCDVEPYSVMTVFIRSILVSHCSSLLPSKCQLSSLINLISERLVLHYFKSIESRGEVDAVPIAADVVSSRIVCSLYRMLTYLSKVDTDEWPAILGTSLQTLQGNQKARTVWNHAMTNVMQSCAAVMAEYPCAAKGLRKSASLYLTDHLRAISALIQVHIDKAYDASFVRAVVIVSSHVVWSQVHSLVLCDKLRSAAALLVSQDDDNDKDDNSAGDENEGSRVFFACVPSMVAHRIDVTTSSLQVLRDVMTKMDAVEPAEYNGTSWQAEVEGWTGFDLNQSQVDMQWQDVEEHDISC